MKSLGLLLCAIGLVCMGLGAHSPSSAAAADLDCADFSSQAEAQENLLPGDPYGLDGDNDGVACEDNPCPCSYGSPSEPPPAAPPKPPPYRRARPRPERQPSNWRGGSSVATRPSTRSLGGCNRLGETLVHCRLTAREATQNAGPPANSRSRSGRRTAGRRRG